MDSRDPDGGELRIELVEPDELFVLRPSDVARGAPALDPGVERIRRELGSGPLRGRWRLAVLLPREYVTPAIERGIKQSLVRYCEVGIARLESELRALRREGMQSLGIGVVLLAVCLALAELVLHSALPAGIRDFFGNGLFLVAAWVGMWYPLETLIYSGRPFRLERRVLRALRDMEVEVQALGECEAPADACGRAGKAKRSGPGVGT